MKTYQYLLPVVASAMLLAGCDDQKMEWGVPADHNAVTASEIPIAVKEVLANYENIKDYAQQYHPNTTIGLGFGKLIYMNDVERHQLAVDNFQMITWGNAMKHDAVITNTGTLDFSKVSQADPYSLDEALDQLQADGIQLWGHNFFWHTQQKQDYLYSLIKPKKVVISDSDIETILSGDAANFNGGTTGGWGSWGGNKDDAAVVDGIGPDGSAALMLKNKGDGNFWDAQCAYTLGTGEYLQKDVEYTIRFKAKSSIEGGQLQFQYQNGSNYGSQGGYNTFTIGTEWETFEYSFTITDYDDVNRIILNFGKVGATYYIDDIEFGFKKEDPMENILAGIDSNFEGEGQLSWGSWGSGKDEAGITDAQAHGGSHSMMLKNKGDGNFWEAQFAYTLGTGEYLEQNKKYILQFYAKSTVEGGQLQFQYQNGSTYGSQGGYSTFDVGSEWTLCEKEFTITDFDDVNRIIINFGKVGATYYIDDVKFGLVKSQGAAARRAGSSSYFEYKTAEQKKDILTGAMEAWVKGMAEHLAEKGVTPIGYDVINEGVTDPDNQGNCYFRGFDNQFNGSDQAPVEGDDVQDGLQLNWADGHFYWGYYVPDYAVKAFEMARQYLPAETKLFYNDYNLESSDNKRAKAIEFVKAIDQAHGSAIVDGIGTQMHVAINPTDDTEKNATIIAELKMKIDKQFQELAATGKLVRVTELDVDMCGYEGATRKPISSPSANQYKAQADTYRMIVESYLINVPEAQQSGITIWSLTDQDDEHTYWLPGGKPNLFDEANKRKWAYKGVCDGIAGEDLGLKYGGENYKTYFEKQNVSSTVE